jgi:hypothetical protein
MPRSQPHGHRRGRAQAQTLPGRRAIERFRDEVVVKSLFESSPVDLGVPIEPGHRTTVTGRKHAILHGTADMACDAQLP